MSPRVRALHAALLVLGTLGAVWGALLWYTGGFDARLMGLKITAHQPVRPVALAVISLVVYAATGGRFSASYVSALPLIAGGRRLIGWPRLPTLLAFGLAIAVAGVAFVYGSKVAGGSDSWGYLGFSEQWLHGTLTIDAPLAKVAPWPDPVGTFSPLGYRPAGDGSARIVPTYSAGFPLMLAAAKTIAGEFGKYLVVPFWGAVLVLATFGLGRRLVSPAGGVIAAALVATSPIVLQSSVVMLSDLPTAGAWAAALYFLTGATPASALLAGLAAGLAVLTRPNHLPLAAILALTYFDRMRDPAERRRAIQQLVLFSAAAACGIGGTAAINAVIYGSPFMSGYGALSGYFALSNVIPNLWRYPAWIIESQTPLALLGLAALLLPVKGLWPGASRPAAVLVPALFALGLLALYLIYAVFDAWWYLRFVLALWPPMMVGAAAILLLVMRSRRVLLRIAAAVVVVAVGLFQITKVMEHDVFDTWKDERRYISGALMTAKYTVPNSVVMSMQHSGSVRYYGGRMTVRYDAISRDHIDDAVAWFTARGIHVYLLAEDWELTDLEQSWAGTHALDATSAPPVAMYLPDGRLFLFDLSSPRGTADAVHYSTEVERGLTVPGPVDVPPLVVHEP